MTSTRLRPRTSFHAPLLFPFSHPAGSDCFRGLLSRRKDPGLRISDPLKLPGFLLDQANCKRREFSTAGDIKATIEHYVNFGSKGRVVTRSQAPFLPLTCSHEICPNLLAQPPHNEPSIRILHIASMPAIHVPDQELPISPADRSAARARETADGTARIRRIANPVPTFVAVPIGGVVEGAVAGGFDAAVGFAGRVWGRGGRRRGRWRVLSRRDADGRRLRGDGAEWRLWGSGWGDGARGGGVGWGVGGRWGLFLLEGYLFGGFSFGVVCWSAVVGSGRSCEGGSRWEGGYGGTRFVFFGGRDVLLGRWSC